MEIILLEKIQNVGDVGDVVHVKNGYARNFLLPRKKAVLATPEAKAEVEEKRRQLAEQEALRLEAARERAEKAVRELSITRLCTEEGHLYGSVSPVDISEAFAEAGVSIEKSEIVQPDGPVKEVGEHEADVILHPEVRFTVKIQVQGEQSKDPLAEEAPEEADASGESAREADESTTPAAGPEEGQGDAPDDAPAADDSNGKE